MEPFVPPPYPYDRLAGVIATAKEHEGGAVDLSIGMTDVHTCKESLRIDDLELTARFVEALIEFSDHAA